MEFYRHKFDKRLFWPEMPECFICLENEKDQNALIFCDLHQFHVECLKSWGSIDYNGLFECLICKKRLIYDINLLRGLKGYEESKFTDVLIADDLESYHRLVEKGPDFYYFEAVVMGCAVQRVENSSVFEIL